MTFSPSPWNVSLHLAGSVVRVGVLLALVRWLLPPSWWSTALQAMLLLGTVYVFPSGILSQRFVVTPEGLIYEEGEKDPRTIPWARVTAYRFGSLGRSLVLLDERDGVRFLLGKPVVTKHRARLRRTIAERCRWARRLSWVEYWKVVAGSVRDGMGGAETSP